MIWPPAGGSPSTLTSPVTTDPLTFAGAVTFDKNMILNAAGSTSGAPRTFLFQTTASTNFWRIGDRTNAGSTYQGMQGGNDGPGRLHLFCYNGIELYGARNTTPPTPAAGSASDPGVSVIGTAAAQKGLVVQGAAAQSADLFQVQNSASAVQAYIGSGGWAGFGTTLNNGYVNLPNNVGAGFGIYWGSDTNLYRSAANTLKTDDNLVVALSSTFSNAVDCLAGGLRATSNGTSIFDAGYSANGELKLCTTAAQKVGFYGVAPIAQQTGVAVTAGGIHAALVSLGLITA